MTKPKKTLRPLAIDERTVDNLIRLMAHERGIPLAEAGRELLGGLAAWFGIDFEREVERVVEEDAS